jgi:hypothetical protein
MLSPGMLHHVALVRTDFSEECSAANNSVSKNTDLGTISVTINRIRGAACAFLVTANVPSSLILVTLMMEALRSSEKSVLTRATPHNILEDGILQKIFVPISRLSFPFPQNNVYLSVVSVPRPSLG